MGCSVASGALANCESDAQCICFPDNVRFRLCMFRRSLCQPFKPPVDPRCYSDSFLFGCCTFFVGHDAKHVGRWPDTGIRSSRFSGSESLESGRVQSQRRCHTDYTIRVVQEMSVFPGIVLIKDLDSGHQGYTATIRLGKGNSVLVTLDSETTEYAVCGWVYL